MKKTVAILLAAVMLLSLAACGGGSTSSAAPASQAPAGNSSSSQANTPAPAKDPVVIIAGDPTSESDPGYYALSVFKDLLEEKTDGRYKVELYTNQALGNEVDLIEGLQLGSIGLSLVTVASVTNYDPDLLIFDLPYLFDGDEHVEKVLFGDIGDDMLKTIDSNAGIKGLSFFKSGFRTTMTTNRPLTSLADIQGLKIRTMENTMHMECWSALGADPTPMSFGDAFTALQQGAIDAFEMLTTSLVDSGVYSICKNFCESNHVYTARVLLMNQSIWNAMSAEDQKLVEEEIMPEVVKAFNEYNESYLAQSIQKIKDSGMNITEIDINELREACQSVYDAHPEYNDMVARIRAIGK